MENKNLPAFPTDVVSRGYNGEAIDISDTSQVGLTKREYFAAIAMQGLLANNVYHNPNEKHKMIKVDALAETAVIYADELLKQLNS